MMDDDTLSHHDDACVAVGVAVLQVLAEGALAVTVMRDGDGGFLIESHSGAEDEGNA